MQRASDFETRLLNLAQRDFPLTARPYADLGRRLGCTEREVIDAFRAMKDGGLLSRIGAVYKPGTVGAACLAAMRVPEDRLEAVAALVSGFSEVNHNYRRDHAWNLWFVVTAHSVARRDAVLLLIEEEAGLPVLRLPMVEDYHLDLGFPLS